MPKTTSIILSIVLTALVIGGLTYYLMSQASQADKQELESQIGELQTQLDQVGTEDQEMDSGEKKVIEAVGEEEKVRNLVAEFEKLNKARDISVLNLFTVPKNYDDMKSLASWMGLEQEGLSPRLYGNASTSYNLESYEIQHISKTKFFWTVNVSEERKITAQTNNARTSEFLRNIEIVEEAGRYYIDKYYPRGSEDGKYSGFALVK